MSLIERYVYAVTRHMAVDQRTDVANELRSTIEDALDEKGSRSKKHIEEVLVSLGDPENLARKYAGRKQYLLGPQFYPLFIRTLKLTFAIGLPIAFILQLGSLLMNNPTGIIPMLVTSIGATVAVAIQMIFWVGLTFFILERSNVAAKDIRGYDVWKPSMLPKVPAKRDIPVSDAVTDIVSYSILVALPLIAQYATVSLDGETTPFFNPAVWSSLTPVVVVIGVFGILKGIFKLYRHSVTPQFAVFNLAFAAFVSAGLLLLLDFDLVNPAFLALILEHATSDIHIGQISQWTTWTVAITILVTIGIYLFDALKYIAIAFKPKNKETK